MITAIVGGRLIMKYAHSKRDSNTNELLPRNEWHPLKTHLSATAELASEFASYFGSADLGYILGMSHDYGKNSIEFDKRLTGDPEFVDHKTAGTLLVYHHYPFPLGLIMAYVIYGHHGGLPNYIRANNEMRMDLRHVLKQAFDIIDGEEPELPQYQLLPRPITVDNPGMSLSLWIRMLFSALVDADFLDTEHFFHPQKYDLRNQFSTLTELRFTFKHKLQDLLTHPQESKVDKARHNVLKSCLRSAIGTIGLYAFTSPTGSGKTWASLAFAFEHAKHHSSLRRIIYALPFTSIIEQTAGIFKELFGEDAVLEHHSNVDNKSDPENEFSKIQLVSENWDASIIVTTHVQLFESLFSAKPSRTRKLHRIAGSIIIIDEAQAIPTNLMKPTLAALKCLSDNYGVTVLFCTATQLPFPMQLNAASRLEPTEIIDDPSTLYETLRRVSVINLGKKKNKDLTKHLNLQQRALCIVNSRKQAHLLYELLPNQQEGVYHLSGLMCPVHRSQILQEIRTRLVHEDQRCIVISTSLIEAGVDLDFPVVYREITGVDSIAQAAGRANREGELERGYLYLFEFEEHPIKSLKLKKKAEVTNTVLMKYSDPLDLEAIRYYFELMYYGNENILDTHELVKDLDAGAKQCSFQFREISEKYKIIDTEMIPIVIPYDQQAVVYIEEIKKTQYPIKYSRKLQRYIVNVYEPDFKQLLKEKKICTIHDSIHYLISLKKETNHNFELYNRNTGLKI